MLSPQGLSAYNFRYENWAATPDASLGTSVTAGISNAEGSWTQVASSSNIAQDCYWMHVYVHSGSTATTARNILLDIGVDPAGGTSYTSIINNIDVGQAPAPSVAGARKFVFPFFIKAGSSVAVRAQGSHTTGTVRVAAVFWGQPSNPENVPVGMFSETIGTVTNSNGQSFTPGNTVDGSWTDLGTTTNNLWWWQVGVGIDNTVITALYTAVEIAWGDATNKHSIFKTVVLGNTSEAVGVIVDPNLLMNAAYKPVPAGSHIYIRGRCSASPNTGWHATVIGIGG